MNGAASGAEAAFRRAVVADPNSFEALLELGALAWRAAGQPRRVQH
jgi:hypothetical protein